ncbi:hypothetical protein [Paraburkholderia dinghuensis]|uniref:Uncharacterized protein n=1 Tax=Paraburkholderia dinghuensis TaxID=2305225 RepID=A0A3N6NER0_9BURK|nr:hypothetical protein [Paraburkholderia dinghuensis]RQH07512.1 hypothetical protein D1Y85_09035 [Paraburkholderia dinghuensis]
MDRRTFLCETGGTLLGAACNVPFARTVAVRASARVAVFDPALASGRVLAGYAARAGIAAWPATDDIGTLWHAKLARRAGPLTPMITALRPSDQFVLTRFAASRGAVVLALDAQARSGSPGSSSRT